MVNIRSVLMDSGHWGDPETFRPERFIDDDGNFKKDEHLILFGTGIFSMLKYVYMVSEKYCMVTGIRMCLGEPFARNTTFIFYTSMIQNYMFSSPPNGPEPSNVTEPGFTTSPAPFKVSICKA
jgi:methyl farnesoate epoxidase / farnesoate epoxidase